MANENAVSFSGPMDPTDNVDYLSQFGPLLQTGEEIQPGFTIETSSEAGALGFSISTSPAPSLTESNQSVLFWVEVDTPNQNNSMFEVNGQNLPVTITVNTSEGRRYQRTWLINVKQL